MFYFCDANLMFEVSQYYCNHPLTLHSSKPYHRVKLMVVGEGKKGKTSLLQSLAKRGKFTDIDSISSLSSDATSPEATTGVVIKNWRYAPGKKEKITFMTWDFGGREEYYAIHQCFLSKRSVYLLVWSVQDGEDGVRGLKKWLENIEACASNSPVIIVGTKMNMIDESRRETMGGQYSRLISEMYVNYSHTAYKYPRIQQIVFVNNDEDVDRLRDYIYECACNYKFEGEAEIITKIVCYSCFSKDCILC